LRVYKVLFLFLASALLSSAVLADGIDPKVIIKPGGGSTTITLKNPNPTVTDPAVANTGQCSDPSAPACVFDVFRNETGSTITHLTIFIPTLGDLIFSCGDASSLSFFNSCSTGKVAGGTDVFFSNSIGSPFSGVPNATKHCERGDGEGEGEGEGEGRFFHFSSKVDGNSGGDRNFSSEGDGNGDGGNCVGEFAVDIEGAGVDVGTVIPVTAITSPEPGAASLMLFGALAFGLLAVGRRFV
jgi:hypothetical protein